MNSLSGPAFSAEAFLRELRTEQFGGAIRIVAQTTSTIDIAWEWLHAGGPEGSVVIADKQTQGRGRLGRPWCSPCGGLWMSIITRPGMAISRAGRLAVGMGIAAAEAVSTLTGCPAALKWPNDLVVKEKKLGGVLVETEANRQQIEAAVLSIGLNVNFSPHSLPEDIRQAATSLLQETGRRQPLESIAARLLHSLEALWPAIVSGEESLVERWRSWDALAGREVAVEAGTSVLRGRARGIDHEGSLVLVVNRDERTVSLVEVAAVRAAVR